MGIICKIIINKNNGLKSISQLEEMLINTTKAFKKASPFKLTEKMKEKLQSALYITANGTTERVKQIWQDNIQAGIPPPLKERTIERKESLGYEKPETPLYATGAFSEGVGIGEVEDDSFEIISTSPVEPSWHGASLYEASATARGVPERPVIDSATIESIAKEELEKALHSSIADGIEEQKPLKAIVVNVAVNVAVSESSGEKKAKKKKKRRY